MKKIISIISFFLIFSSYSKADIAYIDINLILNKSLVGTFLNNHLQKINNKNLKKYEKIEDELIKKEKTLLAQQNILSKDEFQKKLQILSDEVKKYREDKKNSLDELNKIKIENTKEILKKLNPIITEYVDLNSISIVMAKKNIIVGKKNLDITDQIIKLLNQNIQKLNFN